MMLTNTKMMKKRKEKKRKEKKRGDHTINKIGSF
jgi:hypothetical protein